MSVPRRKPWEVSSGTSAATDSGATQDTMAQNSVPDSVSGATSATNTTGHEVPERPSSLTTDLSNMSNTSPYGGGSTGGSYGMGNRYGSGLGSSYGSGMYGGLGGGLGSGYGSSYGSGMYGGGYGSGMYGGGYGSGMYGMGGMGGMNGMGYGSGMYNNGAGGAGGIAEGTQATFQLIESIIGAVGGFAQMLEATYMATHSSFFTMVSLAEQFGNLKNALGSLLGIFALIRFAKKLFYKVTGQAYNYGINAKEFNKFESKQKRIEDNIKRQANGSNSRSRISFKPLLLFLAASIGFPYLLSKAIKKLNDQQQQQQQQQHQRQLQSQGNFNPSELQFAKALYEFNPENPNIEIELKPNDLVAVLSKLDPLGNESKWWKVRSRSGKMGYVPSNYLTIIQRRPERKAIPEAGTQKENFTEEFKKFN